MIFWALLCGFLASLVYFLRRRARDKFRAEVAQAGAAFMEIAALQEEAKQWNERTFRQIYGEDYRCLSPADVERFSGGETFEEISGLFRLTYRRDQDQRQQLHNLHVKVNPHRSLHGPKVKRLLKKLAIQQNFTSNAFEGSSLTMSEAETVLVHGIGVTKPVKDILAALDHQAAWGEMIKMANKSRTDITLPFILQVHSLVSHHEPIAKSGRLRTGDEFVTIKGSKTLLAHPVEVASLMSKLLRWLHTTTEHPIDIVVNFHQRFVRIHPFCDGNGRTCRCFVV